MDETRRRVDQMAEACGGVERDPATLRWSYTMYDASARPRGGTYDCFTSVERFEEMVDPLLEMGMDEIVVYYPPDERQLSTFERIATDVLPRLRARRATV